MISFKQDNCTKYQIRKSTFICGSNAFWQEGIGGKPAERRGRKAMRPNMMKDRQAAEMVKNLLFTIGIQATMPGFFFAAPEKCQAPAENSGLTAEILQKVPGTVALIKDLNAEVAKNICR